MTKPRIAIPVPHTDSEYAGRSLPQYLRALEQAGAEAVVIDLGIPSPEVARLAASCDGVLLPGSRADVDPQKYGASERHPKTALTDVHRDSMDDLLLQHAFNARKPVLGVCYGLQSLNVWRTGTLRQHVESDINHEAGRAVLQAHRVKLAPDSRLAEIVRAGVPGGTEVWVNSSHHQATETVGDGLRPVAWAEDGVIEAIEGTSPEHFVLAVQWHPERLADVDPAARALFQALANAAHKRHQELREQRPDFESVP